jgi:uncharacterized repeat protein (TIGR03803 family)
MKMKIAKRTQIKKRPSHRQFKELLRRFHHAKTKTNPIQANSPACFPAAVDNGLVRPRNCAGSHFVLARKSNQQYKYILDGRCGHCGPEQCRAKENLLVTTKAEEKEIMKVHIRNRFLLPVLAAGLGLALTGRLAAQTFTNLHVFKALSAFPYTNSDGATPVAGLVLSGNNLYGTAKVGGNSGNGTVFRVNADGTGGFTNLHSFPASSSSFPHSNSDGANPAAGLVLSGNTLYGTTRNGGAWGNGTVFAIHTDGMSFTNLHDFSGSPGDGALPIAGLILSGDTLYGTALGGGSSDAGTVFAVKTNGMDFTILYSFNANPGPLHTNSDGANPTGLILSGNTLYGTASAGGTFGGGTVFSLTLPAPPQLTITRSGTNVIVTWPANAAGFALQSATNLVSPSVWSTNLPAPVVVNGQNTVTNAISGTRQFYRLTQ